MLIRFYAVGREISGVGELTSTAGSLPQLSAELGARFGERMQRLLESSTMLLDGRRHRCNDDVALAESDVVDLLPPFAGG